MDSTALRTAYENFVQAATTPGLGRPAYDGGWDADHVLAHVVSVDAGVAAAAMAIVSGARPSFDNRSSLDAWNLDRIIAGHAGTGALIEHVRDQGRVLCEIADHLTEDESSVLVPALLLSNDVVAMDQPVSLGDLIGGLAGDHLPRHARQLLGS